MIKEIKKGDRFVCYNANNLSFKVGQVVVFDQLTADNQYIMLEDVTAYFTPDWFAEKFVKITEPTCIDKDVMTIYPKGKTGPIASFQNYSKEYLDNMQELQAVCDAQGPQRGYTKAEQQFEDVVTDTLKQCQDTMLIKGREYRRNNNPFHNFDKGVEISGKTREEVIWGFALKHFISIQDIRSDLRDGKLPSEELLNEKYGDMINYLLIEKASIVAKIKG